MRYHEDEAGRRGERDGLADADIARQRASTLRDLASNLLAVAEAIDSDHQPVPAAAREDRAAAPHPAVPSKRSLIDRTVQDYGDRRARRRYFPADLFGEPAWDLLLDLFRARLEGKRISVTSACIAADVPPSTALRWIGVLEGEGLVERSRNVSDSRSTWVSLTDRAATAMVEYTNGCLERGRRAERLSAEALIAALTDEAA